MEDRTPRSGHGPSRRGFLAAALAGSAAALAPGALSALPVGRTGPLPSTPSEALAALMEGNQRFVSGATTGPNRALSHVSELAAGQAPFAAVLGCADSRVPPELLFDQGFGDIFTVRVAGNVATPEEIASLEFGAEVLGASLIVVLGHSECGAVKAALSDGVPPGQISTLFQHIVAGIPAGDPDVPAAVEGNALHQMDVLRRGSPLLGQAVREGRLGLVAAVYDLASGRVDVVGRVGV